MEKQIKFRAWDVEKKLMWDSVGFRDSDVGRTYLPELAMINAEYEDNKWIQGINSRPMILMQFTGLLDKNGEEIYEGDIIKGKWKDEKINPETVGICPSIPEGFHFYSEMCDREDEVIGNIYENPELFNPKTL